MGLLLLIPGLVFLFNGTTWFDGEDKVGLILALVGAVLLAIQVLWFLFVASKVRKQVRRTDSLFDRRF